MIGAGAEDLEHLARNILLNEAESPGVSTLSLHDALPISARCRDRVSRASGAQRGAAGAEGVPAGVSGDAQATGRSSGDASARAASCGRATAAGNGAKTRPEVRAAPRGAAQSEAGGAEAAARGAARPEA